MTREPVKAIKCAAERVGSSRAADTDVEMRRLFGREAPVRWPELLQQAEEVLLSEAGSGKTEEIGHVSRHLRPYFANGDQLYARS